MFTSRYNMASENVQQPTSEGHRVHVGNVDYSTTEEQLRNHLASAGGSIKTVELPLRFGKKPGGYAFVVYEKEEDAKAVAEKLNGSELNGRPLKIDPARSKEEADAARAAAQEKRNAAKAERQAREAEKAATGETTAVTDGEVSKEKGERKKRPSKKRAPRRRQPGEEGEEGTAAEAAEAEETGAVAAAEGEKPKRKARKPKAAKEPKEARIDAAEGDAETTPEKPKVKAPTARKPREKRMEPTGEQSKTLIFVANLPFSVDDAALSAIFTNLSINVKSAKVATRLAPRKNKEEARTRRSRGYGFVEVEDPSQQKEAVEKVEGSLVGDRKISAKIANEMRPIEKEEVEKAAQEDGAEVPAAVAA